MVRGLILGAAAFGAVLALDQQFDGLKKDFTRYDSLRAMSGQPPLAKQVLTMAMGFFGESGPGLVQNLVSDLTRYARLRSM
ncbi:MAG: hypothetical protein ACREM2_01690 [Vulcanimicrobiaceae bacterium]